MATPVNLLQLSPTMTEGTIVKWLVKEGDDVTSGQPIAEVETDKAVMEQESFEDGKVLKIVVSEGDRVPVEKLIMVIGEEGEDIKDLLSDGKSKSGEDKADKKKEKESTKKGGGKKDEDSREKAPADVSTSMEAEEEHYAAANGSESGGRILASPLARKMAEEAGLDLARVSGSGPHGRIIKRDVEEAISKGTGKRKARPAAAPAVGEVEEEIRLSGMRETIARRLSESKQSVPHFQLTIEIKGERLLDAVARFREFDPDAKVTVTHFLIKAMAVCAMKHKPIRTQWGDNKMRVMAGAHISVAIAIDDGLVTPVMRNVHLMGVVQIAEELRNLASLARARKLKGEDFQGGVQTLSNLGMYGIHEFNAIINPPESSILAVSAMEERPVIENGQVVAGRVMKITMSCDHRVIDGAVGAQYLQSLKRCLEEPVLLLV